MNMWRANYRCRECGKIIASSKMIQPEKVEATIARASILLSGQKVFRNGLPENPEVPFPMFVVHQCSHECRGIAEFTGLRKVGD